jgi:hypothetical protein
LHQRIKFSVIFDEGKEFLMKSDQRYSPYLTFLARKQGLLGFFAEVLVQNKAMLHLFEKMGFEIERRREEGVYELKIVFQ